MNSVFDVESVDGVEQPNSRHLNQVFERLAAVPEAARDVVGQGQATLDDCIPLPQVLSRLRV